MLRFLAVRVAQALDPLLDDRLQHSDGDRVADHAAECPGARGQKSKENI